jgi:hypothetical protein
MSDARQASKCRSRAKAVTILGVAGALSLGGGASRAAVGPAGNGSTEAPVITLSEEEISDVSLATFYVFDNENAETHHPGLQLARGGRVVHRDRAGCAVACGGGCGGASCASAGGVDGY